MNRLLEQRYAIKLCFKLGKTASEAHEMITSSYGYDAMVQSTRIRVTVVVSRWKSSRGIRAQESRNFKTLPTKVEHLTTDRLLPD